MAVAAPVRSLPNHSLGLSTGALEAARGRWDSLVARAIETSPYTVELSALSETELPGLIEYLVENPTLPFRFLSVHGPSKQRRLSEGALVQRLTALPPMVTVVVLHPNEIEEPEAFAGFGSRLALENMDARKAFGRDADELETLFDELPAARLCLDVAHAASVDPTMTGAHALLDRFGSRLSHVHLSSLDDDGHHIALRQEDERRYAPVLRRCRDVPWILEALPK